MAVLHGPNLNALGSRQPHIYGFGTLADINAAIRAIAHDLDCDVSIAQHSSEGALVDAIHRAAAAGRAIVLNAGAYSHYSYAIADALAAVGVPKAEVHLSNVYARERFRRRSVIAAEVDGCVCGFGSESYLLALRAVVAMLDKPNA
ncbi:MAG: type II 3-dehydroquinate dehydratase [Candidatus Eremiobacteraeota bacterium]|nr:type II 3-dehydroquinate dehydratase [Candidatus Eremiobacteraeota bacterium]